MSLHFAANNMVDRVTGGALERGQLDAAPVWLLWDGTPVENPAVETGAATPSLQARKVQAFVHSVSANAVMRMGMEFSAGDAILGFPRGTDLAELPNLRFILPDGRTYAQQATASGLEQIWDAPQMGLKSVLVRAVPQAGQAAVGEVVHVAADGTRTVLYTYLGTGSLGTFAPAVEDAVLASLGRLDVSTPGEVLVKFGSTVALRMEAGGVHYTTLVTSAPDGWGGRRIELWVGGVVCVVICPNGTVAARNFNDGEPDVAPVMAFRNGGEPVLQVSALALWAAGFSNDL